MTDELITWLRLQLDEDEQVAREASRRREDGSTPTGEHWHWVDPENDQVLTLNPVLDEYVGEGRADLCSVEEYPTSMSYTLPHFVVSGGEETRTVDAMHIARWDPARVLAKIGADRRILEAWRTQIEDDDPAVYLASDLIPRLLAQPYAGQPGWREEWRI